MIEDLIKEWGQKEKELIDSEEYQNADKMGREEILYSFNINKEEAFNEFFKQKYFKEQYLKNAFITLYNNCKKHSNSCKDCMFAIEKFCMISKINSYPTLKDALNIIDKNVKGDLPQ